MVHTQNGDVQQVWLDEFGIDADQSDELSPSSAISGIIEGKDDTVRMPYLPIYSLK